VIPHAYGLATSFSAEYGRGGRVITFCAEYDALQGLGHACGHNLIATSSTASFLGVVAALRHYQIPGRVRLLGTPAEEGGGGKIKLIDAGAFSDVDAAMMIHPIPSSPSADGVAYGTCLAVTAFKCHFTGKAAHAGVLPWHGINAMDAASLAYVAVGLLRQQCRPTDRLNITLKQDEETTSNVISPRSIVDLGIRCKAAVELGILRDRVVKCMEGAALATGCAVEVREELVSIHLNGCYFY
jgi:amidohydrolase